MQSSAPVDPQAKPHPHYMKSLDGLRAVACLIVVMSHIGNILKLPFMKAVEHFGGFGVLIFFALSGFLMSSLYLDEKFSLSTTAKYALARFARIAPAYWIAVLIIWGLYLIVPNADFEYHMTPFMMVRSMLFGSDQGVLWSVPPEIQFYGYFLLLWFSYAKFKEGNRFWGLGVALITVAFVATRWHWGGLMLPSKLHIFLAGFLGAIFLKNVNFKRIVSHIGFQVGIIIALITYSYFFINVVNFYPDLILTILSGLLVASLSNASLLTKPLETNTMRLIGAASFSIYLLHDPILQALRSFGFFNMGQTLSIALMCVISLAIPVAFHFLAEKPLNKLARNHGTTILEKLKIIKPVPQA